MCKFVQFQINGVILNLIKNYPNVKEINVYDDMQNKEKKIKEFTEIRDNLSREIDYNIYKINDGKMKLIESINNVTLIIRDEISKFYF